VTEKVNEYEEHFGHIPPECRQQTAVVGDIKKDHIRRNVKKDRNRLQGKDHNRTRLYEQMF
jgi:hypothetical protein